MSSEIPGDLKFLKSHEWVRVEGGGRAVVGISDHAQELLGDLVYVELPAVGDEVEASNAVAVVESVKAASDVYAPIGGTVTAGNQNLEEDPALVNSDAEGEGWFFKLTLADKGELGGLMDEAAYKAFVASL